MTFQERYSSESTWHGKATVMGLFHLTMTQRDKTWTIGKTAKEFGVSLGLVSENLRLASFIHTHPKLIECPTRQEALKKMHRGVR